jgi:hypothetical protein
LLGLRLVRDPEELRRLIRANAPAHIIGDDFDPTEWLAKPANFALVEGDDLGMFEAPESWPGPLEAHVMFASRGEKALTRAKKMLEQAFAYGATRILGETPETLPHALAFAHKLGFKDCGRAERPMGWVVLSSLDAHPLLNSRMA